MITVLHYRVGHPPEAIRIEATLAEMQRLVGGLVDCIGLPDGIDLWCNDEALLVNDPQPNRWVSGLGSPIYGDFFLARHDDEGGTTSLTEEDLKSIITSLPIAVAR